MRHRNWILRVFLLSLSCCLISSQGCNEAQVKTCLESVYSSDTPCTQTSLDTLKTCFEQHLGDCPTENTEDLRTNLTDTLLLCMDPCDNNQVWLPCGRKVEWCIRTSSDTWEYECKCPAGYTGPLCEDDIDECLDSCPENSNCTNYPGGFSCKCADGYIWDKDRAVCEDIDECQSLKHDCNQTCTNLPGSFTCGCHNGFTLSDDEKSCTKYVDFNCSSNCQHSCMIAQHGNSQKFPCFCHPGYEIDETDLTSSKCIDIKECQPTSNPCEYKELCVEMDGGFKCGCPDYMVLQNDGLTCRDCDNGFYGVSCDKECECGENVLECSPTNGCDTCKMGWTGENCNTEYNFCPAENTDICGEKGACSEQSGKYECLCDEGYWNENGKKTSACTGFNECSNSYDNDCPSSTSTCVDIDDGTYTCSCATGYSLDDGTMECKDIDECSNDDSNPCSDDSMCKNSDGSYLCDCNNQGYEFNKSSKKCEDIDECSSDDSNSCSDDSMCKNSDGSYLCDCNNQGYEFNKSSKKCEDIDECSDDDSNPCSDDSMCKNSDGSYLCDCNNQGYEFNKNSKKCEDIDECSNDDSNSCSDDSMCKNSDGSYLCDCNNQGYEFNKSSKKCEDIDECSRSETNTCPSDSVCKNNDGSFTCTCTMEDAVFNANNNKCELPTSCEDDEDNCVDPARCIKRANTVECKCPTGWVNDGNTMCKDIDECSDDGTNSCPVDSVCKNDNGSYTCDCTEQGYHFNTNSQKCEDINECSNDDSNSCPDDSVCKNIDGSYLCDCNNQGYEFNKSSKKCEDIDECNRSETNSCPSDSVCKNNDGSFTCTCTMEEAVFNANNNKCESQCEEEENICVHSATCIKRENTVECECPTGWVNDGNTKCKDINECDGDHACEKICINTNGSYTCECDLGQRLTSNKANCEDIDECEDEHCPQDICIDGVARHICPCDDMQADPRVIFLRLSIDGNYTELYGDLDNAQKNNVKENLLKNLGDKYNEDGSVKELVGGNVATHVCSISSGSVIADHAVVTPSDLSPLQRGQIAEAIKKVLDNGSIPIDGDDSHPIKSISIIVNGNSVVINDACSYANSYDLCPNFERCEIVENKPKCVCPDPAHGNNCDQEKSLKNNQKILIIVASVVGGILLLFFIIVAIWICYCQNKGDDMEGGNEKPFHPAWYFDNGPAVARSIPDKESYQFEADNPKNPMMRMNYHEFTQQGGNNTWRYATAITNRSNEGWAGREQQGWTPAASTGNTFNRTNNNQRGAGLFSQSSKGRQDGNYFFQAKD